jgi:hypothetical protein
MSPKTALVSGVLTGLVFPMPAFGENFGNTFCFVSSAESEESVGLGQAVGGGVPPLSECRPGLSIKPGAADAPGALIL